MQKISDNLPHNLELCEYPVEEVDFKSLVLKGLLKSRKELSPMFFYDNRGSQLFEEITRLEEYYPTQTELKIFDLYEKDIFTEVSDQTIIVEPGSGNNEKISVLLEKFPNFQYCIPIEISRDHLRENSIVLAKRFPNVNIVSVASDYMNPSFSLEDLVPDYKNPLIFFPGSSIGNYDAGQAVRVLKQFIRLMIGNGKLLIGVDLKKDKAILEKAYNDGKGLTAAFNLNALHHIKKKLNVDELDPDNFVHTAWYNTELGRIEMHLVSTIEQEFDINGIRVHLNKGETIHTENSYKFTVDEFQDLASRAGLTLQKYWTDPEEYFSLLLFSYEG